MALYTDGSPTAWEQWYMDTYGVWPAPQATTAAQTQAAAPVVTPQAAAAPVAAPIGPVSANPWGSFTGNFESGLSQDLINWYQQQAAGKTGSPLNDPTYGKTWGLMGEQKYFDDPTGRYRIVQQDAYSAPFTDEYGRQMVRDKNGNVRPYDPESQGQGLNVIDLHTQMGGAYDPSGKYRGALNLKQEIDPMDLIGIAMVAAPFAAAIGGVGAAGVGAAGGTGGGTLGVTGAGGAFLGEGAASGIAAWDAALANAAAGGAAAGGLGSAASGGGGGITGGGGGLSSIGSAIQNIVGGGGGMSWTDLIGPALQLIGGAYTSSQAGDAADAMSGAAQAGIDETRRQFDTVRTLLAPYVGAGTEALGNYRALSGSMGPQAQQAAIEALKGTPQFGMLTQQGEEAILQNASATGGLRGGNTQDALAKYRTSVLSGLIDQQLGRYGGLIQVGQNSAAGTGTAAMNTGQQVANLMQQGGAAQAGGIVAGTNAITNALGGVGGFLAARGNSLPSISAFQAGASQSPVGAGGFGTGLVYGNQDYGQYF